MQCGGSETKSAFRINPATQFRMRAHLVKCFRANKFSQFPCHLDYCFMLLVQKIDKSNGAIQYTWSNTFCGHNRVLGELIYQINDVY